MAASVITEDMVHTVSPSELTELVTTGRVDLIDVRDLTEWEAGHIDGTRPLPLEQLRADPEAALARGRALVFICAKGIRSMQAAKLAERFGYEHVYNLGGGTKEWARLGLPLVIESRVAA
jgi:rhodanese-related sulfurtransferase